MDLRMKTCTYNSNTIAKNNTVSNDLTKIIFMRKSKVSVQRILLGNVIEKMEEHGRYAPLIFNDFIPMAS